MTDFIKTQTSFTHGEVSPEFYYNNDIYGLSKLENMDITSGGGLSRRPGMKKIATLNADSRLISFSVSENENYILVFSDLHLSIYFNDNLVFDYPTPWPASALNKLQYAQRFNSLIIVHPDYAPRILIKKTNNFQLKTFGFSVNPIDTSAYMPMMKFEDTTDIEITLSSNPLGNNFATFTTNHNFWTEKSVGMRLFLLGKQWVIAQYQSPTSVSAYTNDTYTVPGTPITDWTESAFSDFRGWPSCITFHQDRLVFGGTKSWPGGIWMSRVGDHGNFDLGTGLDDEAIFITLLSGTRQEICTLVSSDNLQILTSDGEWAISNKPLTPSSVDIKQHTSVGSVSSKYLQPQSIEGKTVFISANQKDIRELSLDELGENYNANDLCMFSKHLMNSPVDIAYNPDVHKLYVVMNDGTCGVLNYNSACGIIGWAKYTTFGKIKSVCVINGQTYVMVLRSNAYYLEKFDNAEMQDCENYSFKFTASALPLKFSSHNPTKVRIYKISARLLDTKSIFINDERIDLPNEIYASGACGFDGDVSLNTLGTEYNCISAPWTISGNESYLTNVLSVSIYGRYEI